MHHFMISLTISGSYTDLYEITMGQSWFLEGRSKRSPVTRSGSASDCWNLGNRYETGIKPSEKLSNEEDKIDNTIICRIDGQFLPAGVHQPLCRYFLGNAVSHPPGVSHANP